MHKTGRTYRIIIRRCTKKSAVFGHAVCPGCKQRQRICCGNHPTKKYKIAETIKIKNLFSCILKTKDRRQGIRDKHRKAAQVEENLRWCSRISGVWGDNCRDTHHKATLTFKKKQRKTNKKGREKKTGSKQLWNIPPAPG